MTPVQRRRALAGLLSIAALALTPRVARADDKLVWNLSDDLHALELSEDKDAAAAVASGNWLGGAPDPTRAERPGDFEEKKRYFTDASDLGDIVWSFALSLPRDPGHDDDRSPRGERRRRADSLHGGRARADRRRRAQGRRRGRSLHRARDENDQSVSQRREARSQKPEARSQRLARTTT